MDLRFIERIWHIDGKLALAPGHTSREALDRLTPLFHESGTTHDREGDVLTFTKKDPAAQDKMSVFDGGVLEVRRGSNGLVLHYHMVSRALLYCFLAPLLFLAFAGITVGLGMLEKPATEAVKKDKKKDVELPQHWIDKALGAPAPEKPKADKKDENGEDKKPSPTSAYVFAGLFAALYVVGRILEDRLVKSLFRRRLFDDVSEATLAPA